ncbi:hypothetical protein [Parasphingorhabdus sp.]|uniref:hypothetical protein n=1 Tax=Parasphingorhabdus sp. TaxID=2709688 RepID=UPI003A9519DD
MTIVHILDQSKGKVGFYSFVVDCLIIATITYFVSQPDERVSTFIWISAFWFGAIIVCGIRRMIIRKYISEHFTRPAIKSLLAEQFGGLGSMATDFEPYSDFPDSWLESYSWDEDNPADKRIEAARIAGALELADSTYEPFSHIVGEEAHGAVRETNKRFLTTQFL